jgi:serine/threonine protein kinase
VYLAPEVVTRNYDAAADVYSVGVLCFQLLTGRFPYWPSNNFKAPTMNEVTHPPSSTTYQNALLRRFISFRLG